MATKEEVEQFINEHIHVGTAQLALKLAKLPDYPKDYILNQINGQQKAKKKYPFLLDYKNYIFPPSRAIEQSSSSVAARYKSDLLQAQTVLDLSGGMGIDSYFFSRHAERVVYIEKNPALVAASAHNFDVLNAKNVMPICATAEEYLSTTQDNFELIYIDPDRRVSSSKAFKINECEPNVAKLLPYLWSRCKCCLIKLSPMLDLSQALKELPNCSEVIVLAVNNDCKELLFKLNKGFEGQTNIRSVNLHNDKRELFEFNFEVEKEAPLKLSPPLNFLYEPNAAIMKAGAFKSITEHFQLYKLAQHTHLYTSEEYISNFPGRTLRIDRIDKPSKGVTAKANIVCRNFPLKPDQVKKKYKIKDGGNSFLYACTLEDRKSVFITCSLA